MKSEKPKYNLWQNSGYMMALAWKSHKSVVLLCLALSLLGVTISLIGLFVGPTVLSAIEAARPIGRLIMLILLFAAAMMLVNAAFSYVETNTKPGRVEVRFIFVSLIHEKVMTTSYPNTEDQAFRKKLDQAHKSVSDNTSATEAIWGTFTDLLKNTLGFVIYLVLLATVDPLMLAIVLVTTVVAFLISRRINEWGYRHRDEEAEYTNRMYYVGEKAADYTAAKDIRLFNMRGWLEDAYHRAFRSYRSFVARGEKMYLRADLIEDALSFLRSGVAYAYLINLVLRDGLSASQFLLYFTAIGGFAAWVSGLLSGFSTLHKQSLEISVIREFTEYPESFRFGEGQPLEPQAGKPYEIVLRDVSFRYPWAEQDTLSHINLTLKAGEKLAVVGLNGAGKTTLVKLICGFLDPTSGEVLLNGNDIKQYNRRDYYRHFSAVFQDFSLLAATVTENIAQTEEYPDQAKVADCIKRAGLAEKIERLPGQYEAHIGREVHEDGVSLSGGETQRLMLARTLYKDAPILILDEPTAALDPIAESDLYRRYNELTANKTSVFISHRLASTRFCDRILLIDQNRIAEEGTHDTLLAQNGKYAELFEIQSRYYREGSGEHAEM